jgi:hypothetical protein
LIGFPTAAFTSARDFLASPPISERVLRHPGCGYAWDGWPRVATGGWSCPEIRGSAGRLIPQVSPALPQVVECKGMRQRVRVDTHEINLRPQG